MLYQTETNLRIRYGETDRMGYVYYGNYPQFFEVGRTEMLRTLGFTYREWEDQGILLPVRSLQIHYHSPAFYDDLITIRTSLSEFPSARISFDYEIINQKGEKLCSGNTVLVFFDRDRKRPVRPPKSFLQALKKVIDHSSL